MQNTNIISREFIQYAAGVLAETLSGSNIVHFCSAYAAQYDISLPYPRYPFSPANKRTALNANLMAFEPSQQYRIIKELCDNPKAFAETDKERKLLKFQLVKKHSELDPHDSVSDVDEALLEETQHWLRNYPDALSLYEQAAEKYDHGTFHRNLLDDLRLALEKLLQAILGNAKSLENQLSIVGPFIKERGGSPEVTNMFVKLLDIYSKYQNNNVKHNDAVTTEEIEFIFEITSSFMKYLVRLQNE